MAVLKNLKLRDFRNYDSLDLEFDKGINVFLGANGQGKSNLLESIYFLSILRSFRCSQVKNLFRWRQPTFMITGRIEDGDHIMKVGIEYGEKRRLRINGESIYKASEFIGKLNTVAFVPEDIQLIKSSASIRRRFLDITLSQLYPGYLQNLQSYEKALKSRNTLLRQTYTTPSALAAYDELLLRYGCALIIHRLAFFQKYSPFLDRAAADLLTPDQSFTLKYQTISGIGDVRDEERVQSLLSDGLRSSYERDKQYGMTHIGPHRDDFVLYINNRSLNDFGSEGQCRLAAMILKLAKASLLYDEKGKDSITLLVDDVIGELDERGCQAFMACVSQADQVFVACTEKTKLHGVEGAKTFNVSGGNATAVE